MLRRALARRTGPTLGPDFNKLWAASAVSNIGDGITLAAGPMLVVSLTRDPVLVAGAAVAQQLPWLLVSLPAGAFVDRVDRRRLVVTVNVLRGLLIALLALSSRWRSSAIPGWLAAPSRPGRPSRRYGESASPATGRRQLQASSSGGSRACSSC